MKYPKKFIIVIFIACILSFFLYYFFLTPGISSKNNLKLNITDSLSTQLLEEYSFTHPYLAKADTFFKNVNLDSAIIQYEKAAKLFEQENNTEGYFYALNQKGHSNIRNYNFLEAKHILINISNLLFQQHDTISPLLANIYNNLGVSYHWLNEPDSALLYNHKALELQLKIYKTHNFTIGKTYIDIGNVYRWSKFDYYNAEKNYIKALKILESISHPKKNNLLLRTYYNLATSNRLKSDYDKALSYGYHTLETAIIQKDSLYQEIAFSIIANTYKEKKEFDKAIHYFKNAISITDFRDRNDKKYLSMYFNNIGFIYNQLGTYPKAIQYFTKAFDILQKYSDFGEMSNFHQQIANTYQNLNKTKLALYHLKKCLQLRKKYFGEEHVTTSRAYSLLGDFYKQYSQLDSALHYYQLAIISGVEGFKNKNIYSNPKSSLITNEEYIIEYMKNKAFVLKHKYFTNINDIKLLEASLATYLLTDSLISASQQSFEYEGSKLFSAKNYHNVYEEGIDCAYLLYRKENNISYMEPALRFFEKNKYQLILEKLIKAERINKAGIPNSIMEKERSLNFEMQYIKNRIVKEENKTEKNENTIQSLQSQLFITGRELEKLRERIANLYPNYFQTKYKHQAVTIEEIQNFSKQHKSNIIQYFWGDSVIYAIGINGDKSWFVKVKQDSTLKNNILKFKQLLSEVNIDSREKFDSYVSSGNHIFKTFLTPFLENEHNRKGKNPPRLIIIPDGPLVQLPFEALVTTPTIPDRFSYKQLDYLLNHFQISYAYSSSLLLNNKPDAKRTAKNTLGFCYSEESKDQTLKRSDMNTYSDNFKNLKGTSDEIEILSGLLVGKYFTGNKAIENTFKQHVGLFDILHLAVHGIADTISGIDTKLIFKKGCDTLEDGFLHPYEIYNLKMNAKLAVLSACETGIGAFQKGEGVFSMGRAFAYAGCPSLVMSLWKVNDCATARLMEHFYCNLIKGVSIDRALHEAQLTYLKNADEYTAHPSNWAAFIAMGDMSPVKPVTKAQFWFYRIGTGLLLSGLIVFMLVRRRRKIISLRQV